MNTVFIQSNNKQYLGALLAEYALKYNSSGPNNFEVKIVNVDDLDVFKNFKGRKYLRGGQMVTYDPDDLQSFTLSRFMPPELMGYQGRAIVIDPDIFTIGDINELFNINLGENTIAACSKKGAWDTSVMVLECSRLKNWNIKNLLEKLEKGEIDYNNVISLANEDQIFELSRDWNSLDVLGPNTKLLHTTNRLTQPWKTGLPIDFTRKKLPKLFGLIPREPILRILGKYPMHYQTHPNKEVEKFFFKLVYSAIKNGQINQSLIDQELESGHIRKDFFKVLEGYNKESQ